MTGRGAGLVALFTALFTAVATAGAVGWLADAAGEHDGPSRVDPRVAADVLKVRDQALTDLARTFTFIGSEVVVAVLALATLVWLLLRHDVPRAAVLSLGVAGSAVLTVVVKHLVARPRPGRVDVLGAIDHSYSFPSGHTLNSAVFVGLAIWLLWPGRSARVRSVLAVSGVLLVACIAASRVYLGYHWSTDVIASVLIALGWLSVVWLVHGPLQRLAVAVVEPVLDQVSRTDAAR